MTTIEATTQISLHISTMIHLCGFIFFSLVEARQGNWMMRLVDHHLCMFKVLCMLIIFVYFQGVHAMLVLLCIIAPMPSKCKSLLISQYFALQLQLIIGKCRWKILKLSCHACQGFLPPQLTQAFQQNFVGCSAINIFPFISECQWPITKECLLIYFALPENLFPQVKGVGVERIRTYTDFTTL